jgi:cytochrome P450
MGYIERYEAAPEGEKFRLVLDWIEREALPFFAELRERRPIFEANEATLLALREDVGECLDRPSVFTVGLYAPKMGEFMLAQDDTASHQRDKSVMRAMLNRDDLPRIREVVAKHAEAALGRSDGCIELISGYTRRVPIEMVGEYFGFPGPDLATMMRWSYLAQLDNFHNHPFHLRPDGEDIHRRANEAKGEMRQYIARLIPQRLQEIQDRPEMDDVLSRLLRTKFPPGVGFGIERVALNTIGLLVGAVETTSQAVAQAVDELLGRPDQLAAAREAALADDREAFDGYVWEAMRFRPAVPYLFRSTEGEYTFGRGTDRETTIRPGTTVLALTWSAMFDPRSVPDPDRFDAGRPYYTYLHFGDHLHRCLGEHVARVMVPEMVRLLVLRDGLRRADGDLGQIDYQGGPFPERFILQFDAAGKRP